MVEIELCRALRAFIEDAVKDLVLPCAIEGDKEPDHDYEASRVPTVFNGYLPPKRRTDKKDFPFIVVRPDQGESDRDSTRVTVSIIFGAYSETSDGYEHCLNMLSRVRGALMSMPTLTLAGKYQLREEISWSNFAEQPWPYWQIDMKTEWLFQSVQPMPEMEDSQWDEKRSIEL